MHHIGRRLFPVAALLVGLAAIGWAISFGTLPRADFSFGNGDEVKTVDPPMATGQPESRVIDSLFEGLYRNHPQGLVLDDSGNIVSSPVPDQHGNVLMAPQPGTAESCEISADGRIYTFKIRETARWSDGTPVTSHDYRWSWRRMLHPETASRYAYQLYYIAGARKYCEQSLSAGDRVEVEMANRPRKAQVFPRGTIERGILQAIVKTAEPVLEDGIDEEEESKALAEWRESWAYVVDVKPTTGDQVLWDDPGTVRVFTRDPQAAGDLPELAAYLSPAVEGETTLQATLGGTAAEPPRAEPCLMVLSDFDSQVGVTAPDDRTLVVTLNDPAPFFLNLVAFYPLFPVNRQCVETHGTPRWTRGENIVTNGPYTVQFRRLRDRLRMVKNPHYWNAKAVRLEVIDAMAIQSQTTGLNMYLNGQIEWAVRPPDLIIPQLRGREDLISSPVLTTYFYRFNTTRPPLDDLHVRHALNLAIDKQLICDKVMRAGQEPARHVVPPGLVGYVSPQSGEFDPAEARAELAKSKYAREGRTFPKIEILYNTMETHRSIAEVIQQQWKNNLGIDAELRNSEWGTYLNAVHSFDYTVARGGWAADYPDPNTFLDMWVSGGENNETGWSNPEFDRLIEAAGQEPDAAKRLQIFAQAEAILNSEMPILPIYFYVESHMVSPRVAGFYANAEDRHPLHLIRMVGD